MNDEHSLQPLKGLRYYLAVALLLVSAAVLRLFGVGADERTD